MKFHWIATRELEDATGKKVRVSLGEPYQVADAWQCTVRLEVDGETDVLDGHAHGVDAFQALQNGFERIYVDLKALGRPVSWLTLGDTGFARFMPLGLGVEFRRKVEALVDAAIIAFVGELQELAGVPRRRTSGADLHGIPKPPASEGIQEEEGDDR